MIIRKNINILESFFPGEAIVVNICEKKIYLLNPTARQIWKLISNKPKDIKVLSYELSKKTGLDAKFMKKISMKLLNKLAKRNLVILGGK